MSKLTELLATQEADLESAATGYQNYIKKLPKKLWEGWWALWHYRDETYNNVYFIQEEREVSFEWSTEEGSCHFKGQVSDSGLSIIGGRCGDQNDKFVTPLSMRISTDGLVITLNWDWDVMFPRGTHPRRIAHAFPEIFILKTSNSIFKAVEESIPPSFTVVKRVQEKEKLEILKDRKLDFKKYLITDDGDPLVSEEDDFSSEEYSITSILEGLANLNIYYAINRHKIPTLRSALSHLKKHHSLSVWQYYPEIVSDLDNLKTFFSVIEVSDLEPSEDGANVENIISEMMAVNPLILSLV